MQIAHMAAQAGLIESDMVRNLLAGFLVMQLFCTGYKCPSYMVYNYMYYQNATLSLITRKSVCDFRLE